MSVYEWCTILILSNNSLLTNALSAATRDIMFYFRDGSFRNDISSNVVLDPYSNSVGGSVGKLLQNRIFPLQGT